jgi:hypothetical protein
MPFSCSASLRFRAALYGGARFLDPPGKLLAAAFHHVEIVVYPSSPLFHDSAPDTSPSTSQSLPFHDGVLSARRKSGVDTIRWAQPGRFDLSIHYQLNPPR